MRLPMWIVDAFEHGPFTGNPAAVVIAEEALDASVMQAIAAQNNLSETAFCVAADPDDDPDFHLRWFTPRVEIDLAGHPTLATAHVLFTHRLVHEVSLSFATRSGALGASIEEGHISIELPTRQPEPVPTPAELAEGLGAMPSEVLAARDLIAVFDTPEEVLGLRPNLAALARIDRLGVAATARGALAEGGSSDFVSRFFAPRAGVDEDPVTGSAHCELAPFWAERLGQETLLARQIGPRGGTVRCHVKPDLVRLSGGTRTYLTGSIEVPDHL